jgi:hypothetical protein
MTWVEPLELPLEPPLPPPPLLDPPPGELLLPQLDGAIIVLKMVSAPSAPQSRKIEAAMVTFYDRLTMARSRGRASSRPQTRVTSSVTRADGNVDALASCESAESAARWHSAHSAHSAPTRRLIARGTLAIFVVFFATIAASLEEPVAGPMGLRAANAASSHVRELARAQSSKPVTACVRSWGEARYGAVGYNHLVHIADACDAPAECIVSTDVNPEPQKVLVPPHTEIEVITFRGSPARVFVPHVECTMRTQ